MKRLMIRQWRVSKAEPSGLQVWFDPATEFVRLFELEPSAKAGVEGYREGDDDEASSHVSESSNGVFIQEDLPF